MPAETMTTFFLVVPALRSELPSTRAPVAYASFVASVTQACDAASAGKPRDSGKILFSLSLRATITLTVRGAHRAPDGLLKRKTRVDHEDFWVDAVNKVILSPT